jgi:hypothetical protein
MAYCDCLEQTQEKEWLGIKLARKNTHSSKVINASYYATTTADLQNV